MIQVSQHLTYIFNSDRSILVLGSLRLELVLGRLVNCTYHSPWQSKSVFSLCLKWGLSITPPETQLYWPILAQLSHHMSQAGYNFNYLIYTPWAILTCNRCPHKIRYIRRKTWMHVICYRCITEQMLCYVAT